MPATTRCSRSAAVVRASCWSATSTPCGRADRSRAMPIVRRDGRLHGPGVLDMKMGVAMGLLAARAVFETAPPSSGSVAMLITSDEETGSRTSRALIEAEALASDAVLVLEPALAGGALKTSRKGIGQFRVGVTGVAAHAGVDPGQGRQRDPRAGPADSRSRAAARPRARHLGERRCRRRRHPAQRRRGRGARDRRRAGAVAGRRRGSGRSFPGAPAAFARRAARGVGRLRAAADGALGRGRGALRAGAGRGGRARPDHRRGRHRRRLRRQLHRRARRADPRRPGGDRRRRSRGARARRDRSRRAAHGAAGGAAGPPAVVGRVAAARADRRCRQNFCSACVADLKVRPTGSRAGSRERGRTASASAAASRPAPPSARGTPPLPRRGGDCRCRTWP